MQINARGNWLKFVLPRYISRYELVPFVKCASGSPVCSVERLKADSALKVAMAKAPAATSSVIKIGSFMLNTNGQEEFEEILSRLSEIIHSTQSACIKCMAATGYIQSKTSVGCERSH